MRFTFRTKKLQLLYEEERGARKYPSAVIDAFFDLMAVIDSAVDERDFYALKGLHYEKLKGRDRQYSMRLNKQFRLLIEWGIDDIGKYLTIVSIEDYH